MAVTEQDVLDRHKQALGEAHRACQRLGKNADTDYLAPRGHDFQELKRALTRLEGSARQMAHLRSDARWIKLGVLYAKVMRTAQVKFVGQRWNAFNDLMEIFTTGSRRLEELQAKTGTTGPILPKRASDWLILPDYSPSVRPAGMLH